MPDRYKCAFRPRSCYINPRLFSVWTLSTGFVKSVFSPHSSLVYRVGWFDNTSYNIGTAFILTCPYVCAHSIQSLDTSAFYLQTKIVCCFFFCIFYNKQVVLYPLLKIRQNFINLTGWEGFQANSTLVRWILEKNNYYYKFFVAFCLKNWRVKKWISHSIFKMWFDRRRVLFLVVAGRKLNQMVPFNPPPLIKNFCKIYIL